MELQRMFVTLALKADEFRQGLGDAEAQARGFGSRLGGALSGIATVGRAAFLGIGAAAVGGFGVAMNAAIGMNASLEQSTMQFTTLMDDADAATAHVAALFEFGANTPFETQPIIDASKHFQIFGGEALNTMENLTLVGDAAAAVGAPIDEVGFWVGRLYAALKAGQPFGEAAMRLQELGIMTPQVRTAMEEMQAAGQEGTAIFGEFQGALGGFTGAMAMQSQSWTGLTSTIKDQLSILAADTLKPFFDLLKQGLEGLSVWLASPEVQAGLQQLAEGFAVAITKVAEFVTGHVVPFLREHGPQLLNILIGVGSALAALTIIGTVVGWISAFTAAWVAAGTTVGGTFSVMSAIVGILGGPVTIVIAAVAAAIGLLTVAWRNNWGDIQGKTEAVVGFLRGLIETFLANVRAWWAAHGEGIVETARQAWELIQGLIDGVINHIQLIFEAFRLLFEGDFEAFGQKIIEIWENAWNTVVNFLSGLWGMILPWLAGLWESIRNWFTSTDWGQLGRNIIDGIVNGINAVGQRILDVLGDWVQAAIDWAKRLLGISSPSRVFYEIGVAIVEGLAEGINTINSPNRPVWEGLMEMLNFAGDIGGIAGGFGRRFSQTVLNPMKAQLEMLDNTIGSMEPLFDRVMEPFGGAGLFGDWRDPAQLGTVLQQLTNLRNVLAASGDWLRVAEVDMAIDALGERNNLNEEYIRQQEKMLALEQARADMDFLKSQLDLIALVRDNQDILSPDMLAGLQFGLGGDPAAFMDVTVAVWEALVNSASQELNALNNRNTPAVNTTTPGMEAAGAVYNINEQTINGGQHIYMQDDDESYLEQIGVLLR